MNFDIETGFAGATFPTTLAETIVNPTVFLAITADAEPSSCLQTEFQGQQKTFTLRALKRKDLDRRVYPFTELFCSDSCARVVTSHTVMALMADPYMGRHLRISTSS